ncbi:MAG: hypothetical protein HY812_07275 [Planctomycetes bacterium]|nr:hypothetical protein [Planctomycetota bacterium]
MAAAIERRRAAILAHERTVAERVARIVLPAPPVSAWEVILPLLLVFRGARRRQARDWIAANHLVTKKLALEAACDLAHERAARAEVQRRFEEETRALLERDLGNVYADSIRERQIAEMELLLSHYERLLQAEGQDHAALVRGAYAGRGAYQDFLDRLIAAEQAVIRAAQDFLGERSDPAFVSRLLAAAAEVRAAEALAAFAAPS